MEQGYLDFDDIIEYDDGEIISTDGNSNNISTEYQMENESLSGDEVLLNAGDEISLNAGVEVLPIAGVEVLPIAGVEILSNNLVEIVPYPRVAISPKGNEVFPEIGFVNSPEIEVEISPEIGVEVSPENLDRMEKEEDIDDEPMDNIKSNKKRKSYTAKFKLKVLSEYIPNQSGSGFAALGKKHGIDTSVIRRWHGQKSSLLENGTRNAIHQSRRLPGGGRKPQFTDLEKDILQWIKDRNLNGLQVKEKYIIAKAKQFAEEKGIEQFSGSFGWLKKFKDRFKLVSRRKTSIRQLPDNASQICLKFITDIREFIVDKKILPNNILNMDQVPRYFEGTTAATITEKGSKKVLLRKSGTSHKRFTASFTIAANGTMLKPHLLFSKIKRMPPNIHDNVMVALNTTGMWSQQILDDYIKEIIMTRPATALLREPVLLLIDSYGPHVKLFNSKKFEKFNLFIKLVPAGMTSLLQPLDVAVNKSFQSSYNDCYNKYIETAISDSKAQTKAGNAKMPSYGVVSTWVHDWTSSFPKEIIIKAFVVCGIKGDRFINEEDLHPPLKELILNNSEVSCEAQASSDHVDENFIDMYIPESEDCSFYRCLFHYLKLPDFESWYPGFVKSLIDWIQNKEGIRFDQNDIIEMESGNISTGFELQAISEREELGITLHILDRDSTELEVLKYGENFTNFIDIYQHDKFFSLAL